MNFSLKTELKTETWKTESERKKEVEFITQN